MSEQGSGERVWDIIENVGVCMLTTQAAGRLRATHLGRPDRKAGLIFAVTDVHTAKQDAIEATPPPWASCSSMRRRKLTSRSLPVPASCAIPRRLREER